MDVSGCLSPIDSSVYNLEILDELAFYSKAHMYNDFKGISAELLKAAGLKDVQTIENIEVSDYEMVVDLHPNSKPFMSMTTVNLNTSTPTLIPEVDVVAFFIVNMDGDVPVFEPKFMKLEEIKKRFPEMIKRIDGPPISYLLKTDKITAEMLASVS